MSMIRVLLKGKTVKVEGHGFVGTSCNDAMGPIEEALGMVRKTTAKPEQFVQPDPDPVSVEQR